jgi:hypothetical protein
LQQSSRQQKYTPVIVILYGRNLINFVAVKVDPSETPVSCAKLLNDFRGLIFSPASVSRTFSSVSTTLFDCFFMSHTERLARHFFTCWDTHDCGNWRVRIFTTKLTDTLSVSFFPCKRFDNKHTLFNSEFHFSINDDRLPTTLTKTDY